MPLLKNLVDGSLLVQLALDSDVGEVSIHHVIHQDRRNEWVLNQDLQPVLQSNEESMDIGKRGVDVL